MHLAHGQIATRAVLLAHVANLSMRQVHLGITSGNTDVAMGSNIIVSEPPSDPNVSIVLMATKDDFATRAQDIARLEAGFIAAGTYYGQLFGDHVQGMRTLNIIQRVDATLPTPGQRLVLVYREGYADAHTQYISIRKVEHAVQTFEDANGTFERRVVTLHLGQALERDYPGFDAQRETIADSALKARTKIRTTVWGNAAKYYGVQPLAEAGVLGRYSVRVPSIYERVVPSAEAESPIVDGIPISSSALPVGAVEDVTITTSQAWTTTANLVLPTGCRPNRLRITAGATTITGKGGLLLVGTTQVGTVDYQNGVCTLLTGSYPGSKSITYRPAAWVQRVPQSSEIPVTAEGRSQSYVGFILPLAEPGTLSISYRAQGRWYVLQDDGSGQLRGSQSGYGAGTYNPDTGSYLVTLGALPDVDSSIVLYWGVPTQETRWRPQALRMSQTVRLDLAEGEVVKPDTLVASWGAGKVTNTLPDGTITGDAEGFLWAYKGEFTFSPNEFPPVGTQVTLTYAVGAKDEDSFTSPARNGNGDLVLSASTFNIHPWTLEVEWSTHLDTSVLGQYTTDQLASMGALLDSSAPRVQVARDDGVGGVWLNGVQVGTVDYATGLVTFKPDASELVPRPVYSGASPAGGDRYRLNYGGIEYVGAASLYPSAGGYVKLRYYSTAGQQVRTSSFTFEPELQIIPGVETPLVAGSLLLQSDTGVWWIERLGGLLQEYANGTWTTRGTVDLATGRAKITSWTAGRRPKVGRICCTSTVGDALSSVYIFRTAAAPIRPGSLSLQMPASGGGVEIVTSTTSGQLVGDGVRGTVDAETGLVRAAFGRMVPVSEIEGEPWFNPETVENGLAWKPEPRVMSRLRYAAVAYEFIPVDPEIIGVNPVRLPSDGRVPIFEVGDYAVVHTHDELAPQVVTDNQTISLGVERLSRIVIWDADDKEILHGWARDLDAGTVQILNRDGWAQPVRIAWSIEHMALVREAQIGGQITLNRPLTHHFPAGGKSYISSALMLGDRYARVSHLFDQQNWDGVTYQDTPSGNVATATYNDTAAPIEVDNTGAITQRWALQFLTPTTVRVVGESVGVVVASHSITEDLAPINPNTGTPYFTMRKEGWGGGWAQGNLLRLNTVGAGAGFSLVRAVQPGDYTELDHRFSILARVDIDRPGIGD